MWINIIGSLGFPIFVAVYFMVKIEKVLATNNRLLTIVATKLGVDEEEME